MGSGVPKGAVVNRDLEGLHITPGNLGLGGERQSMVDVDQTLVIVAPDGVRVGVLIQKNQSVAKLSIKQPHGFYDPQVTTTAADTAALTKWQHTSPNQQWIVYDVPRAYMPGAFPWTTKFRLRGRHSDPQDILWVAILAGETFDTEHRIFGWTQYPKPSRSRPSPAKRAAKRKPAPKRRRARR